MNMNIAYIDLSHVEPVGTGDYDDEYLHRRQIAINRWQHDDLDSETTKKSKSFFDEYIHPWKEKKINAGTHFELVAIAFSSWLW